MLRQTGSTARKSLIPEWRDVRVVVRLRGEAATARHLGAWRRHQPLTRRAIPRPPFCTGSSETISRPSCAGAVTAGRRGPSRALWSRSFATPPVQLPPQAVRPLPVHRLRTRSAGRLLVKGPRLLSTMLQASPSPALREPHRSGLSGRAGASMGVEPAASVAVPAGLAVCGGALTAKRP